MFKTLLVALCALFACAAGVSAQSLKFGHFNSQELLSSLPETKNIEKQLNDEASKVENQLAILQEDMKKQLDTYQRTASTMTDEQRAAKETELQELQQRIQVFVQTSRQDIQKKQQELMQPLLQKVLKTVQEVGANNGFLFIFEKESSVVPYAGAKSEDVTPLVRQKLAAGK